MVGDRLSFVYHDAYGERGFSKLVDSWRRYALARQFFRENGLLPPDDLAESASGYPLVEIEPPEADDASILRVHSADLLTKLEEADARGTGYLDYGDTPAWSGVLRRARLAVGGTLLAARLVAATSTRRAFNPAGGLHHARRDRVGGFCPLNDIVIAVRSLQVDFDVERIAIVDLDGHHGDGTEALLYDEPILTVSMHRYGERFYPGTGAAEDVGRGAGRGFNLNVPLERGTGGEAYLRAFKRWVLPAVTAYRPELIFLVVGADSHGADPLVRLDLALPDFRQLASLVRALADDLCRGRLVCVAGGGYSPEHVVRTWAVYLATLTGAWHPDDPRWTQLFDDDRLASAGKTPFPVGPG